MKSRFILAALCSSIAVLSAASAQPRIGYIDSQVLTQQLPEFQDIQRQLESLRERFQQEAIDQESKLKAMQEAFTKQELLMSEARKAEMQQEMETKFMQLQQFTQEKLGPEGELARKHLELSSPIYKHVNDVLKTIAAEESYDLILDAAAGGVIVFADPQYDLTEKLVARLTETKPTDQAAETQTEAE